MSAEFCKIKHARSGQRIQRTAGIGHGHGHDGSEKQAGKSYGHFAHEKKREDAVGALAGRQQRGVLREHIEEHTNQQKHGELNKHDNPAGEQGAAAVALTFRGEETLHDDLVRAVGGHGEKSAADESGPESVFGVEIPGKIEKLEFVTGAGCHLRDFGPSAGDTVQQNKKCHCASGEINEKLGHVGPNHGFHSAFEGVEHGERDDNDDRELFRRSEDNAYDQRDGRDAHAFGNRPRDQESAGRDSAHAFTKTFFDQRIGGEEFAAKISGQQQQYDEHAADQVAEDELKKSEISAVGDGGGADDRESGSFCGNDRKRQRPPGRGAPAQKIVRRALLAAAKTHAQRRNAEQVGNDNGKVERMDAHRVSFPARHLDAAKKCVEDSGEV